MKGIRGAGEMETRGEREIRDREAERVSDLET